MCIRDSYIALPNILAGEELVPELIQDAATPEALAQALLPQLNEQNGLKHSADVFAEMHRQLRDGASGQGASVTAALEILKQLTPHKR